MPFKSEKQRRFLWARKPGIAKRWTEKYGFATSGRPEKPKKKIRFGKKAK